MTQKARASNKTKIHKVLIIIIFLKKSTAFIDILQLPKHYSM
jgi:hypothetical protein